MKYRVCALILLLSFLSVVVSFVRAAPIATGKTIINPITKRSYTLLSKLGTGGFAIVYLADEIPEAGLEPIKVAIKITQGLIGNTEYREMAEIEALIAQELCGGSGKEGVVQVKDHFPLGDYSYATVMEVMSCDLKGLRTMLEASAKSLSVFDRVQLIYHATKQILPAIADLHERGLVHGDIKMENILIKQLPDGNLLFKLADFGLVRPPIKKPGELRGTRQYLSPEVLARGQYDYAMDIWALGVALLSFFVQRPIFPISFAELPQITAYWQQWLGPIPDPILHELTQAGFKPRKTAPEEPDIYRALKNLPKLRNMLLHMLEFDPKKRYTANQLISHPFMTEPEELTDINAQQIIQDYEQFALSANFNYQLMNQQRRIDMHLDLNDERTPGQTNSYDPNRENLWQSPQVKLDPWQSKSPRLIPSPRQPPRIKTNETSAVVPESWEAWDSDS